MRTLAIVVLLLATLGPVRVAVAEPVVIAVDGKDIYIDLGARDGVGAGSELELLHEVVVRDPRSGTTLRDRFALGTLAVVKSGDHLSVARADDELAKRVLAGDRVRLLTSKKSFVDPWAVQVEASKAATAPPVVAAPTGAGPAIDHAELARKAWEDTLGEPPERRIARWDQLLRDDPKTPYAKLVTNEIASLRAQVAARDAAIAKASSARSDDRNPRIAALATALARATHEVGDLLSLAAFERTVPGRAIPIAFLVRDPARVGRAWLYVRPHGDPGFRRLELVRDGDAYLRATIARELVRPPRLEWYVEVQDPSATDTPEPVLGSQAQPQTLVVEDDLTEEPIREGRSHVDAHVDYVDFDGGLNKGFDQYYQAEIDFTYRFITPVYAVRLGFGTLSGVGGPKDVIDADPTERCKDTAGTGAYRCKRVTFSYVYSEVELRLRPNVALMLRPQAGLLTTDTMEASTQARCSGSDVAQCDFLTGVGGRARLRLGSELGTNLVLGAGFSQGVGTLLEAAYHWLPTPVVPVQLTVQVTDQPVPEDFGVRLIGDVGLRQLSWFYPSLRLSYQARDIDHAGFSGGLAMNFDW